MKFWLFANDQNIPKTVAGLDFEPLIPLGLFLRLFGDDPELKSLLRKEFLRSKLLLLEVEAEATEEFEAIKD